MPTNKKPLSFKDAAVFKEFDPEAQLKRREQLKEEKIESSIVFAQPEEIRNFQQQYLQDARAAWNDAVSNEDDAKAQEIEDWVALKKDKQIEFKDAEELNFSEMEHYDELTSSLRRRFGHKNRDGSIISNEDLIDKWSSEQHTLDFNTSSLLVDAATIDKLTPQQKADYLLQMEVWERVSGTGEGSQDLLDQALEIGGALLSDPLTYFGLGTLGVGLVTKAGAKKATKAGVKKLLRDSVGKHAAKFGVIGAIEGGTLGALHDTGKQITKLKAKELDVSENMNWERVATTGAVGVALGGTLSAVLAGGGRLVTNLVERRKVELNLTNKEMVDEISDIKSEVDFISYVTDKLGGSKELATELAKQGTAQKLIYNKETNSWVTSTGEPFKPRFVLSGKEEVPKNIAEQAPDVVVLDDVQRATLVENNINVDELDRIVKEELIQSTLTSVPNRAFTEAENIVTKTASNIVHSSTLRGTLLGGDVVAARAGAKHIPEGLRAVSANRERNVAQMSDKLGSEIQKTGLDEEGLLALIRDPKIATNTAQKKLVNLWQAGKQQEIKKLHKNGVIKGDKAAAFLADVSYVPRVYNYRHLLSPEGSKEFADLLNKTWETDPKAAESLIRHITGNHSKDFKIAKGGYTGPAIKDIIKKNRLHAEDSASVVSSHIEKSRKIKGIAEEDLDPFMLPLENRLSRFFDDVIFRNELANKFGPKNEKVVRTIEALERRGPDGIKQARDVREYYFTAVGDSTNSETLQKLRKSDATNIISKINTLQNLKLAKAAIPNASQALVYGAIHMSNNTNAFNAIMLSTQAIVKTIFKTEANKQLIRRAGVLGEMDMQRMMTENNLGGRLFDVELKGFLGPLDYLNDSTKFLRMVGFHGIETINRGAGALMGATKAQMLHRKYNTVSIFRNPAKRARIAKELKELGIDNPRKKELTDNDIANAGFFFNKDINFSGETMNIPKHWHGPWGKLLSKFKSFSNYSARFMKRHVLDELFKNKNPTPLITLMAIGVPAGLAVEKARNELTNLFSDDATLEENREAIELMITGLSQVGAFGVWTDVAKSAGGSSYMQRGLAGPAISQAFDIAGGIGKLAEGDVEKGTKAILKTLTPPLPGKKALFEQEKKTKKTKFSF